MLMVVAAPVATERGSQVFVKVTGCAALDVPRFCTGKDRLAGDRLTAGVMAKILSIGNNPQPRAAGSHEFVRIHRFLLHFKILNHPA